MGFRRTHVHRNTQSVGRMGRTARAAGFALAAALFVFGLHYRPVVVQGRSMYPTLRHGQVLFMSRSAHPRDLKPGDIILFRQYDEVLVKRVYALEGQTVRMAHLSGTTLVLKEAWEQARYRSVLSQHPRLGYIDALRVPARHLYVVGDNESESEDSRDFGPIPARSVIGLVRRAEPRRPLPGTRQAAVFPHAR